MPNNTQNQADAGGSNGRHIIRIAVSPAAKETIERIADRYDLKEFAVASRMFEWFATQDDIFVRSVLGFLYGLELEAADAYLRRKAEAARANRPEGSE